MMIIKPMCKEERNALSIDFLLIRVKILVQINLKYIYFFYISFELVLVKSDVS